MSVSGIGAPGFNGYDYQAMMRSREQKASTTPADSSSSASGSGATSGSAASGGSPGFGPLSLGGTEEVTGAVTATLPNGITLGIYSFAPIGSEQGQAGSSSGSSGGASGGSSTSSSNLPDFAAMTAALEEMVDHFMAASHSTATAAYQQSSSSSSTQDGTTGTIA